MPTTYAIPNGATAMNVLLYTGTGGTQNLTSNLQNWPDLIWIKNRNSTGSHVWQDSNRGFGSATKLSSNSTNAENNGAGDATDPQYGYITTANATSFSAYAGTNPAQVNTNTATYVAWQWNAGSNTTTSNTTGTITSTVSANAAAGFSIVKYTGTGALGTVGHGLSAAPAMIIFKNRSTSIDWLVYHQSIGNGSALFLNLNAASYASSAYFNSTSPTSSVFTVKNATENNGSGNNIVAYCWAQVAGFSQFGTYTGNGSSSGPFIYTGFQPKFVMFKQSNSNEAWYMYDTARSPYNNPNNILIASLYNSESTNSYPLTILSNGFQIPTSWGGINTSGAPYIYMAFASNPFKYSNAF